MFLAFICIFLFAGLLFGQGKEGNNWVLGYPVEPGSSSPLFGGSIVNFNGGKPDTSRFETDAGMSASGTISDENGNLLFYSSGCRVYNSLHQVMPGGDELGGGEPFEAVCNTIPRAGHYAQWMVALPWPRNPGKYKLIQAWQTELFKVSDLILEANIDMELKNGLGDVTEKNKIISSGIQYTNFLSAVRHGNGIDWWITIPEWRTNEYCIFLLDSLGLHGPDIQDEAGVLTGSGGRGQAAYSPDGTRYAEVCFFQGQIMDFDRCTGRFSNPRVIQFDTSGANQCAGVAFSPNSRYLYVSRCDSLYQYDMAVEDFNSTRQTVAYFDGVIDSSGLKNPFFYTMLSGPDGKIYMNSPGSTKALHIIHHPNEKGIACDFQQSGLDLPTLHYGQLPNLPNFRLGALDPPCGSDGCDTLPVTASFSLFPNPATDHVVVSSPNPETGAASVFYLYDALGRLLMEERMDCLPHRIELADLPAAGYFYRVFGGSGQRLGSGTLVKMNRR